MIKLIYFLLMVTVGVVMGSPQVFRTESFKVGIEYDHSLPMSGGSDRFRHRNNYDPFFVTVTTTAKIGYVVSYLEVSATTDEEGEVTFKLIRGETGSKSMVFQLVSNHSDFLSYSYLSYGIKEEEYKKLVNIISIPVANYGTGIHSNLSSFASFIVLYLFNYKLVLILLNLITT